MCYCRRPMCAWIFEILPPTTTPPSCSNTRAIGGRLVAVEVAAAARRFRSWAPNAGVGGKSFWATLPGRRPTGRSAANHLAPQRCLGFWAEAAIFPAMIEQP